MRLNLKPKLFILITPLIVFPLLLLGWIAYSQIKQNSETNILREMSTLLNQVSLHIEDKLSVTRANIELYSRSNLIQKYLTTSERDRYALLQPTLMREFDTYLKAYPEYQSIQIVLPDGYVDTHVARDQIAQSIDDISGTAYFETLSQHDSDLYSAFITDMRGDKITLLVSKPIALRDPSKDPLIVAAKLRGYLIVSIGLDFLSKQIKTTHIGQNGFLFATDNTGNILLNHHDKSGFGQLASKYIPSIDQPLTNDTYHDIQIQGVNYLLQARAITDNLNLYASIPVSDLHKGSHTLALAVGGITVFTILLTISLLFQVVNRKLISPIQNLRNAARDIGHGNLGVGILKESDDELGQLAESFSDMRDNLKASHEQVRYLAYHDSVTGLPNRRMFREFLQDALADAERNKSSMALLFLDLDNFKRINDTLGHHAGDELLQELARRLSDCIREQDLVAVSDKSDKTPEIIARLGGDEFIILLTEVSEKDVAAHVADRLLNTIKNPVHILGQDIHTSSSIGITFYPQDATDAASLIKNADIAMYDAKAQGKNNYQFFTEAMNGAKSGQLEMESRLRKAITNGELVLHYQPVLDGIGQHVVGAEALVRWNDPEIGQVFPDTFIPLAEETGLIVPLGEWVLREACRQCLAWHHKGMNQMMVSVNMSAVQLQRSDIVSTVRSVLEDTGLPASALELELTETSLLSIRDEAETILNELSSLGIQLALDDFGTGYSSLTYLKRFYFDRLKIDRSFVGDLESDNDNKAICAAIIAMAHRLGIKVTAEGIETPSQLMQLTSWDCDNLQGFFFSKPIINAEFEAFVVAQINAMNSADYF